MLRSLYTSGTAMLTQTKRMDTISNNLANVNTRGFKKDLLVSRSFSDMLIQRIKDSDATRIGRQVGPLNNGIHIDEVVTDFQQGGLEETGKNTDIALRGSGFLVVATPGGERYTRDGAFVMDGAGYLVTSQGDYLLGNNGPIQVGTEEFVINPMGEIFAGDQYVDTLRLVDFTDPAALRKEGDNLYLNSNPQNAPVAFAGEVAQGFLESSNVNLIREMVDMMEVTRNYESNQRMVRMLDESLGKAVNEIGRV